jgi:hypothetical protein
VIDSFDIPIGINDLSWYINIPQQGACYCAALVLQGKTWERPLVFSNTVSVPAVVSLDSLLATDIIALSEADKLDVTWPEQQEIPASQETVPFPEHGR